MPTLKPLLARNRSWALQQRQRDPGCFEKLVSGQQPHSLWIGCSDSRVPAEVLTGARPGELFVHRNIANMIDPDDDSFMSVLQYALHYLNVERVVLCGHYGCGGVLAALSLPEMALANESSALSRRIGQLRAALEGEIHSLPAGDESAALNALVEANVRAQFAHLLRCGPVQALLESGRALSLHGCVYDLASGHLTTLVEYDATEEVYP